MMEQPSVVTKSAWGGVSAVSVTSMNTPTMLYIHHTATEQHGAEGVRAIQRYHMNTKNMRDIAYSFLIDNDGTIFVGRGWDVTHGANYGADNSHSHSFCFLGNMENRSPTALSLTSAVRLAAYGRFSGHLNATILGHRDEPPDPGSGGTDCPGQYLYSQLQDIRFRVSDLLSPPHIPQPKDDNNMLMVQSKESGAVLLVTGGVSVLIVNNKEKDAHVAIGIKILAVSHDQFRRYELLRVDD